MRPKDLRNIHTTRNSCRDALPCMNMVLKLPQYFYLLILYICSLDRIFCILIKKKLILAVHFWFLPKNVFSMNVSLLLLHIYAKFLFQDAYCGQSILHSKNIFILVWCRIFVAKVCFFIISDFHNFGLLANIQIIWSHSEEAGKRGKERELQ